MRRIVKSNPPQFLTVKIGPGHVGRREIKVGEDLFIPVRQIQKDDVGKVIYYNIALRRRFKK